MTSVTTYERVPSWPELGFTIAFTGMARKCLIRIDPDILEIIERISQFNPVKTVRYWDGYSPRTKEAAEAVETAIIAETSEADTGYAGCLRSRLLAEITPLIAEKGGVVVFGKQLVGYDDNKENDKVKLTFTTALMPKLMSVCRSPFFAPTLQTLMRDKSHRL